MSETKSGKVAVKNLLTKEVILPQDLLEKQICFNLDINELEVVKSLTLLWARLMVGRLSLEQLVAVRICCPQPYQNSRVI